MTRTKALLTYLFLIALLLGVADYFYARGALRLIQPAPSGDAALQDKIAWYGLHASKLNVIFLGDSRTYCGIHPDLLDPLLGTRSLNLSSFANWLPTQLALVRDLIPKIPKGTTVVWSVGWINFQQQTNIQNVYPIGIANAGQYFLWGMPLSVTIDNVLYYNPALHFLTQRGVIRQRVVDFLDRKLDTGALGITHARASDGVTDEQAERLVAQYRADPNVTSVGISQEEGAVVSLTLSFKHGSYYRIELDPAFFRRKQGEFKGRITGAETIDGVSWRMFEEILQAFKNNGVNLIVNVMEEAPFVYTSQAVRDEVRGAMARTIGKRVREFGFAYVHADFDKLSNADFFDYNHLNSRGAQTFIPMLADLLRPLLPAPTLMPH